MKRNMSSKYYNLARGRSKLRHIALRRNYREEEYEGYGYRFSWKQRGHRDAAFDMVADWDIPYFRALRSEGWKSHCCRRQWEHRVIEAEKHARNRLARARREGVALWPDK